MQKVRLARFFSRRPFLFAFASAVLCLGAGTQRVCSQAPAPVTIVDLDVKSGRVSVQGRDAEVKSAPGSTVKPFVLMAALEARSVTPETRVACRGTLRVGGRNLTCAHPRTFGVLDAEEALAYSCNTFFATVSRQMSTAALVKSLRDAGMHVQVPGSEDEAVLLALGLRDVSVSPLQMARSYQRLASRLAVATPGASVVRSGLLGSVEYGMARAARTPGIVLGGKTGTAHDSAPTLQHGWFAGLVFSSPHGEAATRVIVVFAPGGSGNDAAAAAGLYLRGGH